MRIVFRKISDEHHVLEVVRDDGTRESLDCETRSYLVHDLLHLALESEARLDGGFWGSVSRGMKLGPEGASYAAGDEMSVIERVAGALSALAKGRPADEMMAAFALHADALGAPLPEWLTKDLVTRVEERMRRLTGRWRATPYGGEMIIDWPLADARDQPRR